MAAALAASTGDLVVFLDADVANTTPAFVTGLLGPLLTTDDVALVKGFYTRPLHGDPTGGGRVTELVARPVLELLFPELSWRAPAPGRRDGGPPLGLREGRLRRRLRGRARPADRRRPEPRADRLAQVDLGVRIHRNRPLHELRPQAVDVLRAALDAPPLGPTATPPRLHPPSRPPRRSERGHGSTSDMVSNRGPADVPRRPRRRAVPVRAPAAWSRRCTRSSPGSGTTWVSVTMGAADRVAVARGLMRTRRARPRPGRRR